MRRALALAAVLGLSACGGRGAIFLTIDGLGPAGALRVPDDVDELSVKINTADDSTVLLEKAYPLTTERFPLTLALEQGERTGDRVHIEIYALRQTAQVGFATSLVPIFPEEVTPVTLRLVVE
jgi:hypothetical protein